MGEVWLAEQTRPLRRQVAVKVVKAGMDTAQVLARFDAERQALALMDHRTIAKIFDGGATPEGRPFFAMEYVRGETITRYCDGNRLSIADRLELFIQLCDGVQHAHQKGIIHRDLKPSNVLVSVADGKAMPHIIDFGIAKATTQPLTDQPLFTGIGGFVGTLDYMSPEQAAMSSVDIDTRSDVYSLGVLLYELLTGTMPFDSATLREAGVDEFRRVIREQEPAKPSTRVAGTKADTTTSTASCRRTVPARLISSLRGDLDWITIKALDKDRTRRYQTVNALALDIRRHLNHEPVVAGPPGAVYRSRKFIRRHRFGVASGVAAVSVLAVFAVLMTLQASRVARERDRANQEAVTAKRVSDFLVGLFRVSDPGEARGRTITAREILDKGAMDLETLRDEPDIQARLQATIGSVYTGLGAYEAAGKLLEQSVATRRRTLGSDHPDTLAAINELANLYWFQQRYTEAEPLYLEAVESSARVLGDEHPATLRARYDLASLYGKQTRWAKAEELQRQILAIQQRTLGPNHRDTLASLANLAAYLNEQKRYADAAPILTDVIDRRRRVLGTDHPSTLVSLGNLAFSYHRMGELARAERIYLEAALAYEGFEQALGQANSNTQSEIRKLAEIYRALGKFDIETQWLQKVSATPE